MNRIANEWGQSGIHSPEKAIEHVRELAKQSQTKQNSDNKIIQETPNCSTRAIARMGRSAKR